jgi:hypothetical protein
LKSCVRPASRCAARSAASASASESCSASRGEPAHEAEGDGRSAREAGRERDGFLHQILVVDDAG